MPRRPRIEMVGYYHIVNRGVEQRITYEEQELVSGDTYNYVIMQRT